MPVGARTSGWPFFGYFLWPSKESNPAAGRRAEPLCSTPSVGDKATTTPKRLDDNLHPQIALRAIRCANVRSGIHAYAVRPTPG